MKIKEHNEKRTRIYVDGMTLNEISMKSGIALTTIQHRYSRGHRTMEELTRDDNLHNDASRIEIACGNGKRFLQSAVDKNISLTDISKRSGVPRSSIYHFVYNNGDMSGRRLAKICGVVGISMDYVMGLRRER